MNNSPLLLSMRMAFVMGILLPLAETVRRIQEVLALQNILHWFDDYILGAVLLLAAYTVLKQKQNSAQYLTAAWETAAGALGLSLMGQIDGLLSGTPDPGIFSSGFVLIAKATILTYILFGLQKSIPVTNYKAS